MRSDRGHVGLDRAAAGGSFHGLGFAGSVAQELAPNLYGKRQLHAAFVVLPVTKLVQIGEPAVQHIQRVHHEKRRLPFLRKDLDGALSDGFTFDANDFEDDVDIDEFFIRHVQDGLADQGSESPLDSDRQPGL